MSDKTYLCTECGRWREGRGRLVIEDGAKRFVCYECGIYLAVFGDPSPQTVPVAWVQTLTQLKSREEDYGFDIMEDPDETEV